MWAVLQGVKMNNTLKQNGVNVSNIQPMFFDKNGKKITAIKLNTGVTVYPESYDEKNQTVIFSTEDTPENTAKYKRSGNPLNLRKKSGENSSTNIAIQELRNKDKLAITIKCPATVDKETGSIKLKKSTNELSKSHSLMHIVDKKAIEKAQQIEEAKKQEEDKPWYKNWKIWALILLTIGLATLGILAFRKGGWLNKDKKNGKTSSAPSKTTPTPESVNTPSPNVNVQTPPAHDNTPAPNNTPPPHDNTPPPNNTPPSEEIPVYTPSNNDNNVNSGVETSPNIPGQNITNNNGEYNISGPQITPPANSL